MLRITTHDFLRWWIRLAALATTVISLGHDGGGGEGQRHSTHVHKTLNNINATFNPYGYPNPYQGHEKHVLFVM
jgi:hypothetical protein